MALANASSIHLIELAREFLKRGYETILIAPRPSGASLLDELADQPGLRLVLVPSLRRWGLPVPNGAHFVLECVPALLQCYRRRPSFAYVRAGFLSWLLVWTIETLGRVATMSEHNGWFADEAKHLQHNRLGVWAIRWGQILDARAARRVRVVTPGIGAELRKRGIAAEKLVAIGNATNLVQLRPRDRTQALAKFSLDPGRRYVGFIGNLARWQGLDTALAAFREIKERHADWHLLIAGDGPERARLEVMTRSLGLDGVVTFLGAVAYADAALCISGFDIAIAPFTHARNAAIGLSPLKIRDYAACGRPVVTSDIPGLRELSDSGWLTLHRPDDPLDLAGALIALMEDERRRAAMGAAARIFAEANFSWQDVAQSICAAMEESGAGSASTARHIDAPRRMP